MGRAQALFMSADMVHKFERAGLGKAPYRVLAVTEHKFQACQGAPVQAAGTCDYCPACIMYAVNLISADGKRFKVGLDCADSVGDAGLRKVVSDWQRAHDRKLREAAKARKVARSTAAHADLLAECEGYHLMGREAPSSFLHTMATSIMHTVKAGKNPSDKQRAAYVRAKTEAGL